MLALEVDILTEVPIPEGADINSLALLVERVLLEEEQTGDWSIAIVLTSDEALRALHLQHMGIDSETDVMTFPTDGPEGTGGGDIVISVERATQQAPDWGQTTWDEIRFLVVRGVLHLRGWVDEDDADRDAMLDRQRALIAAYDESESGAARPRKL